LWFGYRKTIHLMKIPTEFGTGEQGSKNVSSLGFLSEFLVPLQDRCISPMKLAMIIKP